MEWVLLPATRRAQKASKGSDVVRPARDTLHDCLQQVEKYDSDSSGDCSEGEVGDDEEGGCCAAGKRTQRRLFHGLTRFLLSYHPYLLSSAFHR